MDSLTAIEREIIADIHAVCARCGWPTDVRPTFEAYLERRGHFYEKQIKRLGGWKRLCALGGMVGSVTTARRVRHDVTAPDLDRIVADVRRVAQSLRLKPGAPLTRAVYHRSGGRHGPKPIGTVGGWAKLSAAAGHPSRRGEYPAPRHHRGCGFGFIVQPFVLRLHRCSPSDRPIRAVARAPIQRPNSGGALVNVHKPCRQVTTQGRLRDAARRDEEDNGPIAAGLRQHGAAAGIGDQAGVARQPTATIPRFWRPPPLPTRR